MKIRCQWVSQDPLYIQYHDHEWGVPVYDDALLFEMLILESFQAGLSWITILKKRENFRAAFDQFDYHKIAEYDDKKVEDLMNNEGIIRHRGKILATIQTAKAFIKIQEEFGTFSNYVWQFTNQQIIDLCPKTLQEIPPKNELSDAVSKDFKKRGIKFMGSTTTYAFLQAVGIINDHIADCICRK